MAHVFSIQAMRRQTALASPARLFVFARSPNQSNAAHRTPSSDRPSDCQAARLTRIRHNALRSCVPAASKQEVCGEAEAWRRRRLKRLGGATSLRRICRRRVQL